MAQIGTIAHVALLHLFGGLGQNSLRGPALVIARSEYILGAQLPVPSLGLALSEGRNFLLLSPWPAVFSGFAILFLSFGFNLLGDALRDALDPH